jgi:hypothetical protein
MVKKKNVFYTIADWRKDNPVESDITELINAARAYAFLQVPHVGGGSDDPEDPLERFDNLPTELELAIRRGEKAIRAMMEVSQARKAAGFAKKVRGKDKSYDPESVMLSDPQVQVVLQMLRGETTQATAYIEVAKIISPKEKIDTRTIKSYVNVLIRNWGFHAERNQKSFYVENTDS